ncbi:hypothetical protein [Pseudothauera rhizosphaerae]|uniref:ABC-type transport auxiliary lipoprotein component domain-containing protein n=1 Tax=Pseudothauera rhizosphaerae TaxID=2565932 RepID=A0A4V3W9W2_9RHOO|nr:hypothetical protein [Pseudothauera rhizosphaerae]THF56845.1 hypothetical protein E6O51_18600 [Pseudothauera rhizosphaerae]
MNSSHASKCDHTVFAVPAKLTVAPLCAALAIAASGCATPAPDLSTLKGNSILLPAGRVIVHDFVNDTTDYRITSVDTQDYLILPKSATNPSFRHLVVSHLTERLAPDLANNYPNIEVTVLDARILVQLHGGAMIPIIGIATVFKDRKHICEVDASLRYGDNVTRKVFAHTSVSNRSYMDMPQEKKGDLVSECLNSIIHEIAESARNMESPI